MGFSEHSFFIISTSEARRASYLISISNYFPLAQSDRNKMADCDHPHLGHRKMPVFHLRSYASPSRYLFYSLVRWSVLVTCRLAVGYRTDSTDGAGKDALGLPPFLPLLYSQPSHSWVYEPS